MIVFAAPHMSPCGTKLSPAASASDCYRDGERTVLCGNSQESDNQEPEHDRHGSQDSENKKSQHPGIASRECGTAISHGSANNDPLLRKSLKPSKEDFQQVAAYARSGHHGKRRIGVLTSK
jgi:hypothetical protein